MAHLLNKLKSLISGEKPHKDSLQYEEVSGDFDGQYKECSFSSQAGEQVTEIHYSDWGKDSDPVILCVHGLTGNGYDFDFLAPALVDEGYRVIAVDLVGRGRSSFLKDPLLYNYETYIADLLALIKHLNVKEVDWLGVSLGGLLGMCVAAMDESPIRRLIINDVGPEVPQKALDFIYDVIRVPYYFDTVQDLEARMRKTRGLTWGPLKAVHWHHMAEHNARACDDGRITYAYDAQIARIFESEPVGNADLWACWDAIKVPVFVIHGGFSVLLTKAILKKMEQRGPEYDLVRFHDCGHVPSLMRAKHIHEITRWLKGTCNVLS